MMKFFTYEPQSKEQLMPSHIYGIRFGEKDRGLSTCKPWTEQAGGLDLILQEAAQDFEVFKNIQEWNKKIQNL